MCRCHWDIKGDTINIIRNRNFCQFDQCSLNHQMSTLNQRNVKHLFIQFHSGLLMYSRSDWKTVSKLLADKWVFHKNIQKESPPAWTQEAYHPPRSHSKCLLFGGGGTMGTPPGPEMGYPPRPQMGYPPPDLRWGNPPDLRWSTPPLPGPEMEYPPPGPQMGYPPWTWDGVTPWTWDGVPPYLDLRWGTPHGPEMGYPPDLRWGTPPDLRWGTPLPRPEMGYPPTWTWTWTWTWDGIPPPKMWTDWNYYLPPSFGWRAVKTYKVLSHLEWIWQAKPSNGTLEYFV